MSITISKMLKMDMGTSIDTLIEMYGHYETIPLKLSNEQVSQALEVLEEWEIKTDANTVRHLWESLVSAYQEANNG
ncbi:TPA: hypothetical protein ACSCXL_004135 [Aeromonas veronii]